MFTNFPVIGLVGASGAGKTTLAEMLEAEGFVRIAMAKPLKDALKAMGLTKQDLYGPQAHRAAPSAFLCGKSPRYAMMTIGTEWGREMIGEDIWVNAVQEQIIALIAGRTRTKKPIRGVVVEDVRFPNEWAMIERMQGQLWMVRRPEVERMPFYLDRWRAHGNALQRIAAYLLASFARAAGWEPLHESEFHWPNAPVDAEFFNEGSKDELKAQLHALLERTAASAGEHVKETDHAAA